MSSHPLPDRFEFRRVLGKGGVGVVLLTWDRERGEEVALKSVRLAEVEADAVAAEKNGARLQKELARVAPHVPRIFEEGEDAEFYYYVMEYVPGKDLSQVLAGGPLPEHRAIHIAIQLFDFLARLHSFAGVVGGRKILGIIHGDIKPENIRLQDDDRVRVIDFGIAKQLSLSRSYTKSLFGSLPYLPPERLEHGQVDVHSDLWAATVVLYSMVSGRLPYAGTTEDVLVRRIRSHEIVPLPGTCSRPLQWIIHTGLSFEVDRRFPTAAKFKEELEILRAGGSLDDVSRPAAPKSVTTKPSQPIEHPPDPPRPEPAETKPAETRKTTEPPPSPASAPRPGKPPAPPPPPQVKGPTPGQIRVHPAQTPLAELKPAGARGSRWLWPVVVLLILLGGLALYQELKAGGSAQPNPPVVDPEVKPENPESRARRFYSQGEKALEAAEAGHDGEKNRAEAVAAFEEAARLDEDFADPYLGLARAQVDGNVPDESRFNELREKARKRGFKELDLFAKILADAYLHAGKRQLEEAGPPGGPYDSGLLRRAFRSLEGAVRNYDKAGGAAVKDQRSEALGLKNRVAGLLADR